MNKNQAIINLSTTNLSVNNTHHLSTTAPTYLSATALGNLLASTNSSTTTELTSKQNPKTKTDTTKLEIINSSPSTDPQFLKPAIRISTMEFGHQELPKPEFPTLFKSSETNQQPILTSNILPATITENESLNTIFLFELKEMLSTPLFSGVTLKEKPITAMYTNAKVDGHFIKLILDSRSADSIITKQLIDQLSCQVDQTASAKIITADEATKIPIGEIDDFPIEVNSIIVPIKVLVMKATQYQALVEKTDKRKEKKKEEDLTERTTATEEITSGWEKEYSWEPIKEPPYIPLKCKDCEKKLSFIRT
ncbi:hypothetical protein G9A89_018074 [Geosiphon pyriformis]|nr:hypothetical protein G9A89_018074 [Geosiphon pyriformis]